MLLLLTKVDETRHFNVVRGLRSPFTIYKSSETRTIKDTNVKLFGFEITRVKDEEQAELPSFAAPVREDGAVNVEAGGIYGQYVDLDGTIRTEAELVTKYRQMMHQPEIEKAVNEIVNEAIVDDDDIDNIVAMTMEDLELPQRVKNVVQEEFENVLNLLDFEHDAHEIFKRWYVDGRSYYHVIIDPKKPDEGIKELRYVDPRKIRKVRENRKKKDSETEVVMTQIAAEYYMFSEKGFSTGTRSADNLGGASGIKIAKDSIIHCPSGLMDENNTTVVSHLHNGIKPLNQLRALEDATLVYHLSRAPERRVFYVDVGQLPPAKAEQHVQALMTRHKNRISYNSQTGEMMDQRKHINMLEDYYLPRRDGGKGTEISVLQGGTQLPDLLQSVEYFQDRLYRSLHVPLTRMKPDSVYNLGRATEITRDEVNFGKFIDRLRGKFIMLIKDALYKQLILKNIITPEDWDINIKRDVKFNWARDNYFSELKDLEIMNDRLIRMRDAEDIAGKYISHEYIRRHILQQSDEDMKEMDEQIESEMKDPKYNPQLQQQPDEPVGGDPGDEEQQQEPLPQETPGDKDV